MPAVRSGGHGLPDRTFRDPPARLPAGRQAGIVQISNVLAIIGLTFLALAIVGVVLLITRLAVQRRERCDLHGGCRRHLHRALVRDPPAAAAEEVASGRVLDVAVIGAGHNGLVAAAYLARAGLDVECFERRDIVGGACVTEELWPGVRASPGAYTLSLLRPEIMRDLDLGRARARGERARAVPVRAVPGRAQGRDVVEPRARRARAIERDWSAADAAALPRVRRPLGAGRRARAAADARAARPRALARGGRRGHPRRARSPTSWRTSRPSRCACRSRSRG